MYERSRHPLDVFQTFRHLNLYLGRDFARLLIRIAAAVTTLVYKTATIEAGRTRLISVVISQSAMFFYDHRR